ncbi:MAG: FkbM family methyltransferase [Alphaproteobacteria bacterium]
MVSHSIAASPPTATPRAERPAKAPGDPGAARFTWPARRLRQAVKLARLLPIPLYRTGLRAGVGATIEHRPVLAHLPITNAVDIGANKGQFSLFIAQSFPTARVTAFEPLPGPAATYRKLFAANPRVTLHQAAIGPTPGEHKIYVSQRDDSSSLLPITERQQTLFPGTGLKETTTVHIAPLRDFLTPAALTGPSLLKLDVQGFELAALQGCASLLSHFAYVYVECSFVELYAGQALAGDIIAFCAGHGLTLAGIYNPSYDRDGRAVQADLFFRAQTSRREAG